MGLTALILSVVVDAIWPLRGRAQALPLETEARDAVAAGAADPEAADPLADPPYDPLTDPFGDPSGDPLTDSLRDPLRDPSADPLREPLRDPLRVPVANAAEAAGTAHPLLRPALRLIDWVAIDNAGSAATLHAPSVPSVPRTASPTGSVRAGPRQVTAAGWLAVVGIPVLLVAVAEAMLASISGFLVFVLHVAVLYLSVGLGAFHRQFSELQLLVGAGEEASARLVLARWIGAGDAAAVRFRRAAATDWSANPTAPTLSSAAAGQALLAAYRDVFAPLFWYVVLPGAIGPVLYLFSRFAACYSSPFARTAYYWIDWLPLRLVSLLFALAGRFEDTMYGLRAVSGIRVGGQPDPYLHQRLVLLPVAGGALGLRLADSGVDDYLRTHAPDLDLPGAEPEGASLRSVSGLLLRSGFIALGAYLLIVLLR